MHKAKIEETFGDFAEEYFKIEPIKLGNSDNWAALVKIRKQTELLHYIQLKCEDPMTYTILVTIPELRQ